MVKIVQNRFDQWMVDFIYNPVLSDPVTYLKDGVRIPLTATDLPVYLVNDLSSCPSEKNCTTEIFTNSGYLQILSQMSTQPRTCQLTRVGPKSVLRISKGASSGGHSPYIPYTVLTVGSSGTFPNENPSGQSMLEDGSGLSLVVQINQEGALTEADGAHRPDCTDSGGPLYFVQPIMIPLTVGPLQSEKRLPAYIYYSLSGTLMVYSYSNKISENMRDRQFVNLVEVPHRFKQVIRANSLEDKKKSPYFSGMNVIFPSADVDDQGTLRKIYPGVAGPIPMTKQDEQLIAPFLNTDIWPPLPPNAPPFALTIAEP
ncbi:hypothetical protein [Anthocerotibacter panamensis]|uniref:hypothetical protein n=1 Tax=Anthocerotibacter panamensis TaxID=2857077 RepID=UPI001C4082CA|nr:hypothetical protein [Anthocerotibacter panamensis]